MSNSRKHKLKGKYNNGILDNRVGEKHITKQGYEAEIIEYFGVNNCTIKLNNEVILKNRFYCETLRKSIKNPNHRTVYNIGFMGQGIYNTTTKNGDIYKSWSSIFQRCYSGKYLVYKDVVVCEKWHNFQNFAQWYEDNWKPYMDKTWHLDKDILCKECRIYSPETCAFVPQELNTVVINCYTKTGVLPQGVRLKHCKFESNITIDKVQKYLGIFDTPEEAFQVYKIAKEKHIKHLANKWKNKVTKDIYNTLIKYKLVSNNYQET